MTSMLPTQPYVRYHQRQRAVTTMDITSQADNKWTAKQTERRTDRQMERQPDTQTDRHNDYTPME